MVFGFMVAHALLPLHRVLSRVLAVLGRRLESESPASLARAMPFPTRWDQFFTRGMTLAQLCTCPTKHFDFHAGQLDLTGGPEPGSP